MVAAAVITTFSAVLNSTIALWSVDFHERYIGPVANHWKLGAGLSMLATIFALLMVPVYSSAESIINLLQHLNGLSSMPVLSAFIVGLLFRGVKARAAIIGVVWGVAFYGLYSFWWQPLDLIALHYIDMMLITLITSVLAALLSNRLMGGREVWLGLALFRKSGTPGPE
jgi:SSS family solute:Na+ symporter